MKKRIRAPGNMQTRPGAWNIKSSTTLVIFMLVGATLLFSASAGSQDDPVVLRITLNDLKARLQDPEFVIIDVRGPDYLKPGEPKIPGAVVEDPKLIDQWADKYPKDKTLILYCS